MFQKKYVQDCGPNEPMSHVQQSSEMPVQEEQETKHTSWSDTPEMSLRDPPHPTAADSLPTSVTWEEEWQEQGFQQEQPCRKHRDQTWDERAAPENNDQTWDEQAWSQEVPEWERSAAMYQDDDAHQIAQDESQWQYGRGETMRAEPPGGYPREVQWDGNPKTGWQNRCVHLMALWAQGEWQELERVMTLFSNHHLVKGQVLNLRSQLNSWGPRGAKRIGYMW